MDATCLNCGELPSGRYCQSCGQRVGVQPVTLRTLLAQVPKAVFDVDRGIWHTVAGLLREPGQVINGYLDGRRVRYTNPLVLLLLFTGISAVLYSSGWLDFSPLLGLGGPLPVKLDPNGELAAQFTEVNRRIFELASPLLLVLVPVQGAITRLCFAAGGRNYAEHLIIISYTGAIAALWMTVWFPVLLLVNHSAWFSWLWNGAFWLVLLYDVFVLVSVFGAVLGKGSSVRRAIGAVALIVLSSMLMAAVPMGWYIFRVLSRS